MTIDAYLNKDAESITNFINFAVSFCEEQKLNIAEFLSIKVEKTSRTTVTAYYVTGIIIHGSLKFILFKYKLNGLWGVYRLNIEEQKGEFITEALYTAIVSESAYLLLKTPSKELKALLMGTCFLDADKIAYASVGNHVFVTILSFRDGTYIGYWYEFSVYHTAGFIFDSFEDFCSLLGNRFIHPEMRSFFKTIETEQLQDFMCYVGSCIPSAFTFKEGDKTEYIKYV